MFSTWYLKDILTTAKEISPFVCLLVDVIICTGLCRAQARGEADVDFHLASSTYCL